MNHDIDHTRHDIGDDMFPTGIEGLDEATAPATELRKRKNNS